MSSAYQVWVDFFDDAYRKLYAGLLHPVRTEHEVASVVKLLALKEGASVLDLCCGDGRHSIPLQRRGMRVCGVDLAMPMLRAAQDRGQRVIGHAQGAAQPLWVLADGGRLPLRAAFDVVLLLYNSISFGSREMTRALFANAHRALKPGGQLLVECTHRDHEARAALDQIDIEEMNGPMGKVSIERRFDPIEGAQHAHLRYLDSANVEQSKHLYYRVYTAGELLEFIRLAGFSRSDLFGGYDARPFGIDTPAVIRAAG